MFNNEAPYKRFFKEIKEGDETSAKLSFIEKIWLI